MVASVASQIVNDFNNFTDVKSETEVDDEDKILETSEEDKSKFINYQTECSITEISTNEVRSEEIILQKKTKYESCAYVAIHNDNKATFEVGHTSRDNEHLNNLADVKNETVTHDDDKKISEILEENKSQFNSNETELFPMTTIETNGISDAQRTEFNNGEDDEVVVVESKRLENVNENDDAKEFGNGDDDDNAAGETYGQYLYRMLRPGEDHENGITPKNINSTTSINDHVANGSSSY